MTVFDPIMFSSYFNLSIEFNHCSCKAVIKCVYNYFSDWSVWPGTQARRLFCVRECVCGFVTESFFSVRGCSRDAIVIQFVLHGPEHGYICDYHK